MNHRFLSALKTIYGKSPTIIKKMIDDYRFKSQMKVAISTFLSQEECNNKQLIKQLKKDIIECRIAYLTTPSEFFLFGFRTMNSSQRAEFLPDKIKDRVMFQLVGQEVYTRELLNKYTPNS